MLKSCDGPSAETGNRQGSTCLPHVSGLAQATPAEQELGRIAEATRRKGAAGVSGVPQPQSVCAGMQAHAWHSGSPGCR